MNVRFLAGGRVFTGDELLDGWAVAIGTDGIVRDLVRSVPAGAEVVRVDEGAVVAPGFVDIQVNGGGGVLFNDTPTAEGAAAIALAHRPLGTVAIMATAITDDPAVMLRAAAGAAEAAADPRSGVVGVHLEGPFLNPARKGAHPAEWIRGEEAGLVAAFAELPGRFGASGRVLVTLAPECVGDAAISRLAAAGVLVSGGHSAASFERTLEALGAGMAGFTHLFNAMPPIANRAPGIALAAMTGDGVCGVIADGIHVHPALLRAVIAGKPAGTVVLVSDAMPPAGTDMASFRLGGREVRRADGRLVLEDGTLAGADLDLAGAVRVAVDALGVSLEEALRMASLYPARFLGMEDRFGRVGVGRRADLVVLGTGLGVEGVWFGGERVGALPRHPAGGSAPGPA